MEAEPSLFSSDELVGGSWGQAFPRESSAFCIGHHESSRGSVRHQRLPKSSQRDDCLSLVDITHHGGDRFKKNVYCHPEEPSRLHYCPGMLCSFVLLLQRCQDDRDVGTFKGKCFP